MMNLHDKKDLNNLFLFVGNGSYKNRGCEAIVRGTVEILTKTCGAEHFFNMAFTASDEDNFQETDNRIVHACLNSLFPKANQRFSLDWAKKVLSFKLNQPKLFSTFFNNPKFKPYFEANIASLSLGGDNFTLDYGRPEVLRLTQEALLLYKKPTVLWGCSVGPFSHQPEYEKLAIKHLKKLDAIFAREDLSVDYLNSMGVKDNVHRICDPAFVMSPQEPKNNAFNFKNNYGIGVNFSPLFSKYTDNKNEYEKYCVKVIDQLLKQTDAIIYLIPHVFEEKNNDYDFMHMLCQNANFDKNRVVLVLPNYSAAELKWIISKMTAFIGARTHAAIAAFSTGVPTLTLSYSPKSLGINKDIFGHTDFCVSSKSLDVGKTVDTILQLIKHSDEIKSTLAVRIPEIKQNAIKAGEILSKIVNDKQP